VLLLYHSQLTFQRTCFTAYPSLTHFFSYSISLALRNAPISIYVRTLPLLLHRGPAHIVLNSYL